MRAGALLAAGLLGLAALASADTGTPAFRLEGGASRENLDRGYRDWSSAYLEAAWTRAPRNTFYGGLRRTERFGLDDTELMAGGYVPLSERVTGVIEGSVSPTHEVLAKWSALAQIEAALAAGVGVQLGGRHTEYTLVDSDQIIATVEYYFGNQRAAYTYYRTDLAGEDAVNSHRLAFVHYYGPGARSQLALAYSAGQELESLGRDQLLVSDVRSAVVAGRHEWVPGWALSWELGRHRVLDRYTRNAVRLGVRHEF